jgi:hypothetical protein
MRVEHGVCTRPRKYDNPCIIAHQSLVFSAATIHVHTPPSHNSIVFFDDCLLDPAVWVTLRSWGEYCHVQPRLADV